MRASFASGTFNFSADRAVLADTTSFGLIALSARTQQLDIGRVTSAPTTRPAAAGASTRSPGQSSFTDPRAITTPHPTSLRSRCPTRRGGKIDVRVATPNYPTLPADKVIGVDFDLEGRPPAADDVFVEYLSGPGIVQVNIEENEDPRSVHSAEHRLRRYENGVLTLIGRPEGAGRRRDRRRRGA